MQNLAELMVGLEEGSHTLHEMPQPEGAEQLHSLFFVLFDEVFLNVHHELLVNTESIK